MNNEKVNAVNASAGTGGAKQTIEEKIAIRMKKCGNMANANKGDASFLSGLSDSEKKILSVLLKKCLQSQKK